MKKEITVVDIKIIYKQAGVDGTGDLTWEDSFSCDRAAEITVNPKGNVLLATYGMVLTEALGAMRECDRRDDVAWPIETDKGLKVSIEAVAPVEGGKYPQKTSKEILRGVLLMMYKGVSTVQVAPINISRIEGLAIIDLSKEMQTTSMAVQSAMQNIMLGPSLAKPQSLGGQDLRSLLGKGEV